MADRELNGHRHRLFEYLRRPAKERAQRRAPVDPEVFLRRDIRDAVAGRSRHKCAFCETSSEGGDGVVDHFRPIRHASSRYEGETDDWYAWLAYETDNLLYLCRACSHYKGADFPVMGRRAPYIASLAEVRRVEIPWLIDPYVDRPETHLQFLAHGFCAPRTPRGRHTVTLLSLNRPELIVERREMLDALLTNLVAILTEDSNHAFDHLLGPHAPFMGARRSVLARVLGGLHLEASPLAGSASGLIGRLDRARRLFTKADLDRLEGRILELRRSDQEREDRVRTAERRLEARPPDPDLVRAPKRPSPTGGIETIRLKDFKGVGTLSLPIRAARSSKSAPCLMLLGENSAGKSSVLQAIALALIGTKQAKRLRLEPNDYLRNRSGHRWDLLTPEDAFVELDFRFGLLPKSLGVDAAHRRFIGSTSDDILVLGYGPRRYFDAKRTSRPDGAFRRVETLFRATASLPNPQEWLNGLTGRRFTEVAQVLRIVLSLEEDDELVRDIDHRICVRVQNRTVPVEWLSEGYRSIFALVADILRELEPHCDSFLEAEAIVLIDEIETHLHPRWKMRVMSSLRRALPNVQFIVTTHDPLCLRGMEDGEIVVLQKDGRGEVHALDDLPSVKGMRADQLLTSDYFGLSSTIDPQTEIDLATYLDEGRPASESDVVARLTIGSDASEQIIHTALRRFREERDRPTGRLRTDVRQEAVEAVLRALMDDAPDGVAE